MIGNMGSLGILGIALLCVGIFYTEVQLVAGRWNRKGFSTACIMVGIPTVFLYWLLPMLALLWSDSTSYGSLLLALGFSILSVLIFTVPTTFIAILVGLYVRLCWPPRKPVCA